jgi:hypothetical protein
MWCLLVWTHNGLVCSVRLVVRLARMCNEFCVYVEYG